MTAVCVLGLWHLGCVTAACVADAGYRTIGIDPEAAAVAGLNAGRAPLFEPGLDDLLRRGAEQGQAYVFERLRAGRGMRPGLGDNRHAGRR